MNTKLRRTQSCQSANIMMAATVRGRRAARARIVIESLTPESSIILHTRGGRHAVAKCLFAPPRSRRGCQQCGRVLCAAPLCGRHAASLRQRGKLSMRVDSSTRAALRFRPRSQSYSAKSPRLNLQSYAAGCRACASKNKSLSLTLEMALLLRHCRLCSIPIRPRGKWVLGGKTKAL